MPRAVPARPPLRHRLRSRWQSGVAAEGDMPPSAPEVATATVAGALVMAILNAGAIALRVPWPDGGAVVRLQHHLFDLVEVVGLAGGLALLAALLAGRRSWGGRRWAGWLVMAGLATAAMYWVVGQQLTRQADKTFDGAAASLLLPLFLALYGLGIPAAYLVGAALSRLGVWWLGLIAGLACLVVGRVVLPGDYHGVHTATFWIASTFTGASVAPRLLRRIPRARRRPLATVQALTTLLALAVPPPNHVRLELFREEGAVAAYVLSQTVWQLPRIETSAAVAPVEPGPPTPPAKLRPGLAPVVALVTIEALRGDVFNDRRNCRRIGRLRLLRLGPIDVVG